MPNSSDHDHSLSELRTGIEVLKTRFENLENRYDRDFSKLYTELHAMRAKAESDHNDLKDSIAVLNKHMIESTTGRRVLMALLGASAVIGGFIWELLKNFMHLK